MIKVAVVGSQDFNLVPLFDRTLDSLRAQYGNFTLMPLAINSPLFVMAREYVAKRPGCRLDAQPTHGVGEYENLDDILRVAGIAGHAIYFIRRNDDLIAEAMRCIGAEGVLTLGILWE